MESVELCAQLARFVRTDGTTSVDATARRELRKALDATVSFYEARAAAETRSSSSVTAVDDMVLATLQRLLLTTLRGIDCEAQEQALNAVALLVRHSQSRLAPPRVVELLQTCSLYLPVPTAAVDPTDTVANQSSTKSPEELTVAVLRSIEALLMVEAATSVASLLSQSQDMTHFLAYIVSSLLQVAERERNRSLAEQSLWVLSMLLRSVSEPRVLRMFFPGVSVGMWKVISAPLQTSKVTVAALDCLSLAISACLGETKNGPDIRLSSRYALERLHDFKFNSPAVAASSTVNADDQVWGSQATEKIETLVSLILSPRITNRHSWTVHRALVNMCRVVVVDCRHTLQASFLPCLEELMVLRTHAIAEVAQAASSALDWLKVTFSPEDWLALEPRFAERFQLQLSTLAVQCGSDHEMASIHTIDVLNGYLEFQQHHIGHLLDETLASTFKTLCNVFAFEGFDSDLLRHEEVQMLRSEPSTQRTQPMPYFHKRFSYFHEESSVKCAIRLLRNLGTFATPAVVVDVTFTLLMSNEEGSQSTRDAVLIIFIECLRSRLECSSQDRVHLVGRILDDLFALPFWSSSSQNGAPNTRALMVECVGVCVELAGPASGGFLLYVLYLLVEKLGDPSKPVEQAALSALRKLSLTCGYDGGLQALIDSSMDYLADALCARLEELDTYPQSPLVVEALLRYSTVTSLPLVNEIARSLMRGVDLHQSNSQVVTTLLRSLQLLIDSFANRSDGKAERARLGEVAIVKMSPLTQLLLELQAMTDPRCGESEQLEGDGVKELAPVDATPKNAMPFEYSDDLEADTIQDNDDTTELPLMPFQEQTVDILERCSYFLSDDDPAVCCLVLGTIEKGIRYLCPRQKELLPLVHRIWPSILHRLTVSNRPILTSTMQILATIAETAGDFIGDRFVETAWPSIRAMLESLWASSSIAKPHSPSLTKSMLALAMGDHNNEVDRLEGDLPTTRNTSLTKRGRATLEMKLLEATLLCLRVVCGSAITVTVLVPEMVRTCARFLNSEFPATTIALTQDLLLTLAELNGDEVFVEMARASVWEAPEPPSPLFPRYGNSCESEKSYCTPRSEFTAFTHEYRGNAAQVMEKLLHRERERARVV